MQAGSSIGGSQHNVKHQQPVVQGGAKAFSPPEETVPTVPVERVTLAARFKVDPYALETEDIGGGVTRSKRTLALVLEADREKLEKQGIVFPEIEEVRSNQGLTADGRLELVPVDGTGNPNTTHILQTLEVENAFLKKDAEGKAPIDGYIAQFVAQDSSVIPKGYFGVPDGSVVAPQGFEFRLGTSEAGARTEAKRIRLNRLSDGVGNFAQSSLAGIMNIPYISAAAPFIAMASGGASFNHHLSDLKDNQDLLGYVQGREKLSKTDKISMELAGGPFEVSAKAEKQRLETKVRMAKSKLASTSLLFASGTASVLGYAAAGGALGSGAWAAALTGAIAATPYLAGAGMIIGSSGMVVNSLAKLKTLSHEKAELLALQAKGETHTLKTIERVSPQHKRPVAIGEQMVPIQEQLKSIKKEQNTHRLIATGMTGAMGSIAATVAGGMGALTVLPFALAPAGGVAVANSVSKLRQLSAEEKELVKLHKSGETMAPRQIARQDGSWSEEKIPISTLLADIDKSQRLQKLILTGVGSAGALFGMTVGLGLSAFAVAPLLLIPAAIGGILFPEKVKAFAEKVAGFVSGKFGEAGRSRKELVKEAEKQTQSTRDQLIKDLEPLAEQDPSLFHIPSKAEIKTAKANGEAPAVGYFTYMNGLMDTYAGAGSRLHRLQAMQQLETHLDQAPPNAQPYIGKIREQLNELHMNTEAGWVAREVTLEMKKDSTEKLLADKDLKARLTELGFGTENVEDQFKESLTLENSPEKIGELLEKSRAGDRDASLELARKEVFGAARLFFQSEDELGTDLMAKLVDALARPQDDENLETVIKEVNYQLERPMAPATAGPGEQWWLGESTLGSESGLLEPLRLADFANLSNAVKILTKPLDIAQASAPAQAVSTTLDGPQARMASAFRALHSVDAEAAAKLGEAFATLNDPEAYAGLSQEEAAQKKVEAGLQLTQAKAKLQERSPDVMGLWEKARTDVEEEFFQRSVDTEFAGHVLARPEVAEASERLGVSAESVKSLYLGYLRSEATGNNGALQRQLVDAEGKDVDPAKLELLEVLGRSMTSVTAKLTGGGNDTVVPEAPLGQPEADPQVAAFLEANPVAVQVLESDQIGALAQELQVSPELLRHSYLTLVQANLNPVLTAEFDGRYSAGDIETVKTFQLGSRVGQLVQAAAKPSPEAVAQQVEAGMAGPVVATVLGHPEIKALAENLKVDASALMRTLLSADLAGDKTPLEALAARSQGGDAVATAELQMIQTLAQATLQVAEQLKAPPQQPQIAQAA